MSMNSSSSANSTISSYFSARCSRVSPAARPPSTTFSRPVSVRLKPTPSANRVLTRPCTSMRPEVGGRMPAIVRTSVDLPAPFAPTTPRTLPCSTLNETFWTASISRTMRSRRPRRLTVSVSVGRFSNDVRYVTETSSTEMLSRSDPDSEITLPGEEEQPADDEEADAPSRAHADEVGRRRDPERHDVAPGREELPDRVRVEDPLVLRRRLFGVVEDRRRVEPDPQDVGQEVAEVAEVDLSGGEDHREARRQQHQDEHDRDRPQHRPRHRPVGDRVDRDVDDHRRQEAQERRPHGREWQQHPRERAVEDQLAALDDRLDALRERLLEEVVEEQPRKQVREELVGVPVVVQDVDEQEVDEPEQQRIEDQPELPERRVEMLGAQVGARQLDREFAPPPELLDVRDHRRQPDAMGLVHVPPGGELVLALARGVCGRAHSSASRG